MGTGRPRWIAVIAAIAIALACAWLPRLAAAHEPPAPPTRCHAYPTAGETYATLADRPQRWTCADRDWRLGPKRSLLRFGLSGGETTPRFLVTRLTRFESALVAVERADGRLEGKRIGPEGFHAARSGWVMATALPEIRPGDRAVVVEFVRPRFTGVLEQARLSAHDPAQDGPLPRDLLVAALCGLLLAPLVFNLAFWRVLREPFLLWHGLQTLLVLALTAINSGLVHYVLPLTVSQVAVLGTWVFGAAVAVAAIFAAAFIERDMLDARHRRALRLMVPWIAAWSLFATVTFEPLRAIANPLFYLAWLPVLGCFAWVMMVALRRGSRAVKFQIAAWAPIMLNGLYRIAGSAGGGTVDAHAMQHVAVTLEVLVTALGVIDRFMIMRQQRDRARVRADAMESIAARDPLTGLMNRRTIETRFTDLRRQGFSAMAVIDIDRFKSINDRFGHSCGDAVLRAVASALSPDGDTVALRLGGEEFMLLLRGPGAAERAERRRQAIPGRVAAEVPGLDTPVTASMGLVVQTAGTALPTDFALLYAHCDRLLYEAKRNGRNRTASERVQPFFAPVPSSAAA